jgi:hypothetical protein
MMSVRVVHFGLETPELSWRGGEKDKAGIQAPPLEVTPVAAIQLERRYTLG